MKSYYLIRANRLIYDVLLKIIHQSCVNSLGHFVNSSRKVSREAYDGISLYNENYDNQICVQCADCYNNRYSYKLVSMRREIKCVTFICRDIPSCDEQFRLPMSHASIIPSCPDSTTAHRNPIRSFILVRLSKRFK